MPQSGSAQVSCRMLEATGLERHAVQALSVTLRKQTLDGAMRNVGKLKAAVDRCKETDATRLTNEYKRLVGGLQVFPGTLQGIPTVQLKKNAQSLRTDAQLCWPSCMQHNATGWQVASWDCLVQWREG